MSSQNGITPVADPRSAEHSSPAPSSNNESLDALLNKVNSLIARTAENGGRPVDSQSDTPAPVSTPVSADVNVATPGPSPAVAPEPAEEPAPVPAEDTAPSRQPAEDLLKPRYTMETTPAEAAAGAAEEADAADNPDGSDSSASQPAFSSRLEAPAAAERPAKDFVPPMPRSIGETGLPAEQIERLVLKFLFQAGTASGRQISNQIRLAFPIVDELLRELKAEQMVAYKGAGHAGDYEFVATDKGRERARRYMADCTYFGSAPVPLHDYIAAVKAQTMADQKATEADLKRAFSDLVIDTNMLDRLGPAVNSGRGLFLFGEPGNGKTSIAERVTGCFGTSIWIPRALVIDGEIIRLFDPGIHEELEEEEGEGLISTSDADRRWVKITRPTVIAGGELTMAELEVCQNPTTKICESPLQLKSNCGTLVIDDFGRQRMPVDELLNRWIVPLEKRYDFLNLPSGKKIQVPFDQLIVFSTNLEPKDLVDGAFLRRIPYKIEAADPTEEQFYQLCKIMAPLMGFEYNDKAVRYLVEEHYKKVDRPYRACQPRDLLVQVRNYCTYKTLPMVLTPEAFDFAVDNYFAVM